MSTTANLKKEYAERIAPALKEKFHYTSSMQIPVLKKIVINQGMGKLAIADKKIIDTAIAELTTITGQKAVATVSKKDIANFKLPVSVTSRVSRVSSTAWVTTHWVSRSRLSSPKSTSTAYHTSWV